MLTSSIFLLFSVVGIYFVIREYRFPFNCHTYVSMVPAAGGLLMLLLSGLAYRYLHDLFPFFLISSIYGFYFIQNESQTLYYSSYAKCVIFLLLAFNIFVMMVYIHNHLLTS